MENEHELPSLTPVNIKQPEKVRFEAKNALKTEINRGLEQLEIKELESNLASMAEQNRIYHTEQAETRPDHIIETDSTPPKHNLKELWQISKDKDKSADYFRQVLKREHVEGRITKEQLTKFLLEAENFDFRVMFRDLAITYAFEIPSLIGMLAAAIGIAAESPTFYETLLRPMFSRVGVGGAGLLFVSFSGIMRSPYLLFRTGQEFYKLAKQDGLKSAIKRIPYFAAANLINLVNLISPLGTLMVSFPRNKDVGLVFLNHRVQTSRAPGFLKKGVNKTVQWAIGLGKKKERSIIPPKAVLKPTFAPT